MSGFSKDVEMVFGKFKQANYQIYVVGGAVRDTLMKRAVSDWDFTTDAKPEDILKLFPEGFYDNKFGTVGIPMDTGVFEITTMRKEGDYKNHRHPEVVSWTNKIKEDLARRDFTINALAMDREGRITDPFGGQEDLNKKVIRAVGDPDKRFKEDALRLIRAVRIATELNFTIEEKTTIAIVKNAQLLKRISNQRIRDELFKLLDSSDPYTGVTKLREAKLLGIILPELEACFGILQEGPKHDRVYDIGEHSLLSLKYTPSSDLITRMAALLHDIGKVKTVKKDREGNVTFYNHDVFGGELALRIAKRLNLSKKQSDKLCRLIRYHMFNLNETQTDSAVRRFIKNVGMENIDDMFALRVGDRLGGGTPTAVSWRMKNYRERIKGILHKPFSISDLAVNGHDVMKSLGISPSKKVGQVLERLFEEVQQDTSKNNRMYLLKRIRSVS